MRLKATRARVAAWTEHSGWVLSIGTATFKFANNAIDTAAHTLTSASTITTFSGAATANGVLSGAGALTTYGAVTLGASNTITSLTVSTGALTFKARPVSAGGTVTISAGASFIAGAGAITQDPGNGVPINLVLNGGASTMDGASSIWGLGNMTLSSGAVMAGTGALHQCNSNGISVTSGNCTISMPMTIYAYWITNATGNIQKFTVSAGATLAYTGVISDRYIPWGGTGIGGINLLGGGTMTLSGANTYTGGTTVTAGTLVCGSASALGPSGTITVDAGATLNLNGFYTVAGLGSRLVNNGTVLP